MSAANFILSLARKLLARESKGIATIPNRMAAEQKAAEIVVKLENAGLPLNRANEFIRSEQDLIRILNMIDSTPPVMREVPSGIRSTESAKVFDLKGKEIKNPKNIMGGEEVKDQKRFFKGVEIKDPTFDENLPFDSDAEKLAEIRMSNEAYEQEIAERLTKGNKKGIANIQKRILEEDREIENLYGSTGFGKDQKVDAEFLAEYLAENAGKVYDDLPTKERLNFYDRAFNALTRYKKTKGTSVIDEPKKLDPRTKEKMDDMKDIEDPEDMAQGGRAGFSNGSGGLLEFLNMTPKERKRLEMQQLADKISQFVNIRGKGSKSGEQQIKGAPEGFTIDSESYNFILNADIPINKKINLLTSYGRGKDRDKIEKDGQELFLGEGGSKKRGIGLDINPDAEKGFGGNIMYDPDRNNVTGGITYKFADGGRIGFKDGMTRRTFLKILGGAMSIPIIGKFLTPMKVGKKITKVPMIKTDNVAGKPEWFDALVNKVIIEGDDVTKKFATAERQSIHQKTLDDGSVVRVTEDVDDGAVRVEYESEQNVFGDPVQLQYKKSLPDEGDPRPTAEFTTSESGPVGRVQGPDDFDIDVDEVGGISIKDLDSDVSKLKEYATGKKLTMKEILESKKRRDKAKAITEDPEAQSDAVIARQGDFDPSDYDDYASGGIARMLGE